MDQITKRPDRAVDRFSSNPAASYTLPANMYFAPEVLREETSKIFLKSWIYVAHVSELSAPGQFATAEILDQRIFVIRNAGGELKAFFNVCQHRGHSLLRGRGVARNLIVCPYHAWSYDHDGALQAAPNCGHVKDFDKGEFGLPEIRVDTLAGFVFINLDPAAQPMQDVYQGAEERLREFCPHPDALTTARDVVFDIKANWKNVGDNLLECYHCSTAHKAFVDLVEMETYKVKTYEYWSVQYGECRADNKAYDYDPACDSKAFMTLFLWPNMAFVQFPGTEGLATFYFTPLEPEVTHQVFAYHAPGESRGTELTGTEKKAFDYFKDVLGPEDVSLVEDVQQGLHSLAYHQGRFMIDEERSQISEHAAHHFQNLVARELGMG